MSIATLEKPGSIRSVRAQVSYTVPTGRRPVLATRGGGTYLPVEPFEVAIADAGSFAKSPSLEREGFVVVPQKVAIPDLAVSKDAQAQFRAQVAVLMKAVTGADKIIMSPDTFVRHQVQRAPGEHPPIDFVHSDYMPNAAGVGTIGPARYGPWSGERRFAMYNLWKLLSKGPTNRPLAVCDARSVADEDIVVGESHHDIVFETVFLRYNANHRWAYFPRLTCEELLIFKQADSDPTQPRIVPHAAFVDSSCATTDPDPRISMECRCLALWCD